MSDSLTITGIQSILHWEDKSANLDMFEKKINSISRSTEIVVLPEMFSTGFSMKPEQLAETMDGETLQWMKKIAANKKIILTGSVIIKEAENYFNRLIWMLPNGQTGYYDKRHLFAYADEDKHYAPGNKRLIASAKGWKINLLVCYDLRFPVWSRQSLTPVGVSAESPLPKFPPPEGVSAEGGRGRLEYDVLIYVANWPERRVHAWSWR
jgi:predicted amidohydrolase